MRGHVAGQAVPARALVAAVTEVGAGLPVAAGKHRVAALLARQLRAGLDGQEVDALEQRVRQRLGFGRFPVDALLGQQVVPAKGAKADGAVLAVGDGGLRHRQRIEVDHVVEHAHLDRDQALQHVLGQQIVRRGDRAAEIDRGQVADHEIASTAGGDDLVAADDLLDHPRRAHVLQDLGAQVAGIDHARMLVRVLAVHFIAVEQERVAGFQLADHDPLEQVDGTHRAAADALVAHQFGIAVTEAARATRFIVEVLQVPALGLLHLVGIKQVPVGAALHSLHEQVRHAHRREHVVRAQALVAVVQAQIEEGLDIAVPDVQVHRHRALALAELVDRHGGVVELLDPRHHAAGRIGHATDRRTTAAHVAQVRADPATVLGHPGDIGVGVIDALQAVIHGVDEAARQLAADLAGIGQGGRGHGHVQVGQCPVGLAHQLHAALAWPFVLHQVQGNGQPALLRQFVHFAAAVAGQVAGGQQVQAVVGEQPVALGIDHLPGLLQFVLRIATQDVIAVDPTVGQAFLQAHVGTVLQADIVEAVAAGTLVQPTQVQPRGKLLPFRRHQVHARFRLADQQIDQVIGADAGLALDHRLHHAAVVAYVQLRELDMHGVDAALQALGLERQAAVACFLGDPGEHTFATGAHGVASAGQIGRAVGTVGHCPASPGTHASKRRCHGGPARDTGAQGNRLVCHCAGTSDRRR